MGILSGLAPLPLIPEPILRYHQVREPTDTRFRASARLLQSLWRDDQALAIGHHRTRRGGQRKLGSRLTQADADRGRNFLSPALAQLARHELVYREHGALIEQHRFLGNLLSSQPLAINLFGPLRLDPALATAVVRQLLPAADVARIIHVAFEHSPGRLDPRFTNDCTAFDVAIAYERRGGGRGLLAIELKYAEAMGDRPPPNIEWYSNLAEASGLFKHPDSPLLQVSALQQFYREHLLAQASLMQGNWDEAHFMLVAPRHNHQVNRAAELYAAQLAEPLPGVAPFVMVELETVIDAFAQAGEDDYAATLHDRYTDWTKLDALIRPSLERNAPTWSLTPPKSKPQLALCHG